MKKNKKFQIVCNERQARLISESLDNYMRLLMGQLDAAIDNMRLRFYSKGLVECHDYVGQTIDKLKKIIFPDLTYNSSYGVGWDGIPEVNDMYEIYKCIDKALWDSQTKKEKELMAHSVHRHGVTVKYSKQPLIEVKEIK
jgi:hypothetical protein